MKWDNIKIGDYCEITSSKRIFFSEYVESGIPFYRSKEIIESSNGQAISEPLFISQEKYDEIKRNFGVPQPGDMLLTSVGTIGVPYIVKEDDYFYFKDGNLTWFRKFNDKLTPRYLYYWVRSADGQGVLNNTAIGSSQKALTIASLKGLEIPCPAVDVQNRIVEILSSYDALIENNQKQIKLLEEAAQRLYKEWFVDLRFPGHETTTITDGIPKGWREGQIQDVVIYHDKKRKPLSSMQRSEMKGEYRYYGAASILDYVNDYLFDGTYLLLGEDGTVVTEDGFPVLQYVTGKFWVNNHAHVLTGQPGFPTEYLYMMFKSTKVKDVVTGAAQPKISQARLSNKIIVIPSVQAVSAYCAIVGPMFKKILNLEYQMTVLKEARDRLLPKLMNGEIEV